MVAVALCMTLYAGISHAAPELAPAHYVPVKPVRHESAGRGEAYRVMAVLEKRIGSSRLPLQAKEKLFTMDREDLRLISSLCDRIEAAGDRPGADVALLLAAALIVLS
jgi:hypothetical protein